MVPRGSQDLRSPSLIMAPGTGELFRQPAKIFQGLHFTETIQASGLLDVIIIKFPYNARSDWLKQRPLSENKVQINDIKVDGTSFSDAGSLVTTAHVTREICPRDLKYRKSKTNMGAQKLLLTRCFFSCLSEIGSKQKLSIGRQLLSNSVCVRKTLFVAQCPKFKARVSISVAISNNLKTTGFHHTDRP